MIDSFLRKDGLFSLNEMIDFIVEKKENLLNNDQAREQLEHLLDLQVEDLAELMQILLDVDDR